MGGSVRTFTAVYGRQNILARFLFGGTMKHENQEANYRVTINDLTVCTFPDIGSAINHGWQLCRQQGIPPEFIDILSRNSHGNYISIWDAGEEVQR